LITDESSVVSFSSCHRAVHTASHRLFTTNLRGVQGTTSHSVQDTVMMGVKGADKHRDEVT